MSVFLQPCIWLTTGVYVRLYVSSIIVQLKMTSFGLTIIIWTRNSSSISNFAFIVWSVTSFHKKNGKFKSDLEWHVIKMWLWTFCTISSFDIQLNFYTAYSNNWLLEIHIFWLISSAMPSPYTLVHSIKYEMNFRFLQGVPQKNWSLGSWIDMTLSV